MKLSFFARDNTAVPMPGIPVSMAGGTPARYVAREYVAPVNLRTEGGRQVADKPAQYVASEVPFSCDSDSMVGQRMVKHMTKKRAVKSGNFPLWPADKQTADYLGMSYVPVKIQDGVAVPVKAPSPKKSKE